MDRSKKKNSVVLDFVLTDKGKQFTRSYLLPSINWTLLKLLPIKQIS